MKTPNKKVIRALAIIMAILMVLSVFVGFGGINAFGAELNEKELEERLSDLENAMSMIKKNYKDEVDYDTLIDGAFRGMVDSLDDRWSEYFATEEESDGFMSRVNGEYIGVGVVMSQGKDGAINVVSVLKKSPAFEAGLRIGDVILSVDGESMEGKTSAYASRLLRDGEIGSKVSVRIARDEGELDSEIVRGLIKTESVYKRMLDGNIGYIEIASFDSDTGDEFSDAFDELVSEGMKSLIVDLRDNGGGVIDEALKVISKLVPERREIMHYRRQGEIIKSYRSTGTGNSRFPVALLINGGSASASEIVAGALKDTKAATLIGETTYGKGVAQVVVNSGANDGKAIKFSTYYFLTPNKNEIDKVGVAPDIVQESPAGLLSDENIVRYNDMAKMAEDTKPKLGDRDLNTYAAQQRLSFLGYEDIAITGVFDAATEAAVVSFQAGEGLCPYGVLDYTTMAALEKVTYEAVYGVNTEDTQLARAVDFLNGK